MEFIQHFFEIRPGIVRNVRMGTAIFGNVPIYESGGMALKSIYD